VAAVSQKTNKGGGRFLMTVEIKVLN